MGKLTVLLALALCGSSSWVAHGENLKVCFIYCDDQDASLATSMRNASSFSLHGSTVTTLVADDEDMAFAVIDNARANDEIWLDRSFDSGSNWAEGSKLGHTVVPSNGGWSSNMFNIDDMTTLSGIGAIRACGKVQGDVTCTKWVRSSYLSKTPIDAAATALMQYYKPDGLWQTVGWWNGANCLTAMIGYQARAESEIYSAVIEDCYTKNLNGWDGNFTSDALDDVAWWALAWIDAYDLTGDKKFLDMAALDAEHIVAYRDNVCGDGVWWNIYRNYKNAITNELYIKLAAKLHNRIPGDTKYLKEAVELWDWFVHKSGMVNSEFLVNDGLRDDCTNNQDTTWTYNQGVILGAAPELATATGQSSYLTEARQIADAVISSPQMSPNGILKEPCEYWEQSCNWDQSSFKGIFVRNLGELNRVLEGKPYQGYLEAQVASNYAHNRNEGSLGQYGLRFAGPFDYPDANRQHSVLDAFNSVLP